MKKNNDKFVTVLLFICSLIDFNLALPSFFLSLKNQERLNSNPQIQVVFQATHMEYM